MCWYDLWECKYLGKFCVIDGYIIVVCFGWSKRLGEWFGVSLCYWWFVWFYIEFFRFCCIWCMFCGLWVFIGIFCELCRCVVLFFWEGNRGLLVLLWWFFECFKCVI